MLIHDYHSKQLNVVYFPSRLGLEPTAHAHMSAHCRERERPHARAHKSVSEERPLTLLNNAHERELYSPARRIINALSTRVYIRRTCTSASHTNTKKIIVGKTMSKTRSQITLQRSETNQVPRHPVSQRVSAEKTTRTAPKTKNPPVRSKAASKASNGLRGKRNISDVSADEADTPQVAKQRHVSAVHDHTAKLSQFEYQCRLCPKVRGTEFTFAPNHLPFE